MCAKDCSGDDLVQGLKLAIASSNRFFRLVRNNGVFIPEPTRSKLIEAGQTACDTSLKCE